MSLTDIQKFQIKKCEEKFVAFLQSTKGFSETVEYIEEEFPLNSHYAEILYNSLYLAKKDFFTDIETIDKKRFDTLKKSCEEAIHEAESHFKEKQGIWKDFFLPIINGFVGVLVLALATILVVPIIVYASNKTVQSFVNYIFFQKPPRNPDIDEAWKGANLKSVLLGDGDKEKGIINQVEDIILHPNSNSSFS